MEYDNSAEEYTPPTKKELYQILDDLRQTRSITDAKLARIEGTRKVSQSTLEFVIDF